MSIIERVGKAFGVFHDCLEGFDAESLYISIPDFHNTPKRYEALKDAIARDSAKRVNGVKGEIQDLLDFEDPAPSSSSFTYPVTIRCPEYDNVWSVGLNNVTISREDKSSSATSTDN